MSKVHPAENQRRHQLNKHLSVPIPDNPITPCPSSSVLTVWKKSSMSFQGTDGFTVFNHSGKLVFRVDNYTRKSWSAASGGLLLMDGPGRGLLTLKPQLLSMQHQWTGYWGEDDHGSKAFTMRRTPSLLIPAGSESEAEVFMGENIKEFRHRKPDLKAVGSFRRRNCKIITTATGQLVAQISKKRINTTLLLSDDVFTLVVHPGFEPDLAMAFVIILDRISRKTNYAPILCS